MVFLNEIKVSFKRTQIPIKELQKTVRGTKQVEPMLRAVIGDDMDFREKFVVLYLNHGHDPIGFYVVSIGGISGTVVDTRLLWSVAHKVCASKIIICHNHPSGQLRPSKADESITKKIKEQGELLEIKLLDHVILSSEGMFSFVDNGML